MKSFLTFFFIAFFSILNAQNDTIVLINNEIEYKIIINKINNNLYYEIKVTNNSNDTIYLKPKINCIILNNTLIASNYPKTQTNIELIGVVPYSFFIYKAPITKLENKEIISTKDINEKFVNIYISVSHIKKINLIQNINSNYSINYNDYIKNSNTSVLKCFYKIKD